MSLPPGYRVTDETGNVCKLKKALYELKQFPQAWFGRFTIAMKKFGYQQANTDHTLFIKHRTGVEWKSLDLNMAYFFHKSAPGRGLLFKENDHLDLEGYIDANYEGNITDRRSTSSYFTFVGGNLVTWHSKKLNVATKLHCDNQSAFEIANNLVQHDRTKHVEVDRHFIKEKLEHKLIFIHFVHSSEQLADMLTHAVSKHRFEDSLDKLGITDIYTST
ncbi:unnamed protein product [Prunus armeniaca]